MLIRSCRIRDETFNLLRLLIADRFHSHDVPIFAGALMNQRFRPAASLFLGYGFEQICRDENLTAAPLRGHKHQGRCARLISKPVAWRCKDKNQDQPNDDVVLPGGAGKIPKDKPSEMSHANIFA